MKKGLIIFGAFLCLLIITMIAIPFAFKGKFSQKIKLAANETVNAKVDFSEIELSLFRSFPQLNVELKNITVTGVNEFDNINLLSLESLSTSINISGLWKSDELIVTSLNFNRPSVNLLVNKAGKSNWDIAKPKADQKVTTEKKNTFIDLEKIVIRNASFSFSNEDTPMLFTMRNGTFDISGALKGSNSQLNIAGQADSVCFEYNGSPYASNLRTSIKTGLQADFDKMSFTFLKNELLVNKLPIEVNGNFILGVEEYIFDLSVKSPASSFGELLGFIPEQYQKKLKGVETKGDIAFNGFLKGIFSSTTYPGFGFDLNITGGWLKYPNLPKEIEKIELTASITKPQGATDLTKIDIEKFDASVAGNSLTATLHASTLISDPQLKGNLKGRIDFSSLKQAIPMDSVDIMGIIDASIDFGGKYSSIEKELYEDFKTDGSITLKDFIYATKDLPQKVEIKTANMHFDTKSIDLTNLSGNMGESDFAASGSITNYWAYILKKGVLNGNIIANAKYLNFNQIIPNSTSTDTTETGKPYEVPDNINFSLQATVNRALYDKMTINGITGKIVIKERKVILDGLNMNMLSGKLLISGVYSTPKEKIPDFDFKMDIKDFDVPTAYQSLSTVRHFLPFAKESTGAFNSGISLNGKIGSGNTPIFSTLNGGGTLRAKKVELVEARIFDEIGKYFRKNLFKQVKVSDFEANFVVADGGLIISPFNTRIAGQEVTIAGKQSATKNIDYRIDFKVNKADLSEDVTKYMGFMPGAENISKYPVGINLGGTFDKPEVKVDLTEAKNLVESEFKKKAGSTIQDAIKKFGLDKLFK